MVCSPSRRQWHGTIPWGDADFPSPNAQIQTSMVKYAGAVRVAPIRREVLFSSGDGDCVVSKPREMLLSTEGLRKTCILVGWRFAGVLISARVGKTFPSHGNKTKVRFGMAQIYVDASDIWDLFQKEKKLLEDHERKIAECPEYGTEIYLTGENGYPCIVVYADDDMVYTEICVSPADCKSVAQSIYNDYLTEKVLQKYLDELDEEESDGCDDDQLAGRLVDIEDREADLDMAVFDFVNTALDRLCIEEYMDESDEMCADVKDHFLEYLARKWGLPIYRPMYLVEEDGAEFYTEYPYECMEFDDEDNPIYK